MKTLILVFSLAVAGVACRAAVASRAEKYHLKQTQIADEVAPGVKLESLTVYVLLCPDQRVYVFRAVDSHAMEQTLKHIPRGSVLHYDGNALMTPPKQAQIEALEAFCKKNGIEFVESPTN